MSSSGPSAPIFFQGLSERVARVRALPARRCGLLVGLLLLAGACDDVVVRPAEVESVAVDPVRCEVAVGATTQLTATALDDRGRAVSGLPVSWSSANPSIASVDGSGVVTGHAPGEVEVTASVGGLSGTALVEVLRAAAIRLERSSVEFSADAGDSGAITTQVAISNGGDMPLTGLSASVDFGGGPTGWLTASVEPAAAPSALILQASAAGLAQGTYAATVAVQSTSASGSAQLAVTLDVRPGIPGAPPAPTGLSATATQGQAEITLAWTDNSGGEADFRLERRGPGETQFALLATVGSGVVAHTDGSVAPDGTYVYRVAACTAGACSNYSGQASATTFPLPPTGLGASAVSESRIDLSWTDNSATETAFQVERRTGGGDFVPVATVGIDRTGYSDSGLTAGTTYEYRVRSCNGGGCSGFSNVASATTRSTPAPAAPSGLTAAVVSAARIDLAWTDNSGDETLFRIQRSVGDGAFADLATVPAGVTAYSDTDVLADRVYAYRVAACAGADACSSFSNQATATTPPVPPTGFGATATSPSAITLAWTDASATETGFEIQRQVGGSGGFSDLATVAANATSYDDSGLTPATRYDYRIRSCNDGGCSDWVTATATTDDDEPDPGPAPPTGLGAMWEDGVGVRLQWTAGGGSATEHRIERHAGDGVFAVIATTDMNETSYLDAQVQPDTEYTYRVRACDGDDCSGPSNTAVVATPPAAPSDLRVLNVHSNRVMLGWTSSSTTATSFRIERAALEGEFTNLAEVPASESSYQDGAVQPSTTYRYRVLACNASGCSPPSNVVQVTTRN
jgi:hypothetical protein